MSVRTNLNVIQNTKAWEGAMRRNSISVCFAIALMMAAAVAASLAQDGGQSAALSTSKSSSKIAEIDQYVADIDLYIKAHPAADRILANVASGKSNEPTKWQVFATETDRDKADSGENLNESAFAWKRDGKVIAANFTFQSPSRDWAQFVMYYFNGDGTLAKSASTLNTFQGGVTVLRDDYYDRKGRLLKGTTHCRDLKTNQPKPCGDFRDRPAPLFKKVEALPFYGWLK